LVAREAELETELESRDAEIEDIVSVIADNEAQLERLESENAEAGAERARVQDLRDGVDRDYKDQIAELRMALRQQIDTRQERIDAGRQRLKLQKRAKKVTSETLGESQGSLQARLNGLRDRLAAAQVVAVQFRDTLLAVEAEQLPVINDIGAMRSEISLLTQDCEGLAKREKEGQETSGESLESLNQQYQGIVQDLAQAKDHIERYNEELLDQDGKIEILNRELALARQRYRTTITAFGDDDER
jgi:chromosome segregation ATPase